MSTDGHAGVEGTGTLDLSRARWHVIAQGSWLSRFSAELSPGSISIDRTALSLFGGFSILEKGRWGLDAFAGGRIERWSVASHGFSSTKMAALWVPGAALGARGGLALSPRIKLFASVQGRLLSTRTFEVTHVEGEVTPPIFWLNAEIGLGVQIW